MKKLISKTISIVICKEEEKKEKRYSTRGRRCGNGTGRFVKIDR